MARIKKQRRRLYAEGWTPAKSRGDTAWRVATQHPHSEHNLALAQLESAEVRVRPAVVRRRQRQLNRRFRQWAGGWTWSKSGVGALVRLPWIHSADSLDAIRAVTAIGLARHVLVQHEIEDAFLQPFEAGFVGCSGSRARWSRLAACVGLGHGLRALKSDGLLPRYVDRAAFARLRDTREPLTLALRRELVAVAGGGEALLRALWQTRLCNLQVDEDRWLDIVAWLVRAGIDPCDAGRWVDYLTVHEVELDSGTQARLWPTVDRWGARLIDGTRYANVSFHPCGLGTQPPQGSIDDLPNWSFVELITFDALVEEGRAMSHCVATYGRLVFSGRSSIWSIRHKGERRLTVEVRPRGRMLCQAKGPSNRQPTAEEVEVLRAWAKANTLRMP